MTYNIKIYLLNGEEYNIELENNSSISLKNKIKKDLGYYDFTAIDLDTEKEYDFYKYKNELPKKLLLTLKSIDDVIKKTCCENAGVYKYHQVFEGCKITNGTYINIKCLTSGNGWKLYGINQDFRLIEKEVIGKTKSFVKIEGEPKKKIRNDNILGDYFKYENIRGFFINKEIMKGNKYIVFQTN
jgi:hypothetical protein